MTLIATVWEMSGSVKRYSVRFFHKMAIESGGDRAETVISGQKPFSRAAQGSAGVCPRAPLRITAKRHHPFRIRSNNRSTNGNTPRIASEMSTSGDRASRGR